MWNAVQEPQDAEQWAVQSAALTITLSRADQQYAAEQGWCGAGRPCPCVPPGIRADVAALPLPADVAAASTVRPSATPRIPATALGDACRIARTSKHTLPGPTAAVGGVHVSCASSLTTERASCAGRRCGPGSGVAAAADMLREAIP